MKHTNGRTIQQDWGFLIVEVKSKGPNQMSRNVNWFAEYMAQYPGEGRLQDRAKIVDEKNLLI